MSDGASVAEDHEREIGGVGLGATLPYLGIVCLYTVTILGGLALTDEIAAMGLVIFHDPGDVGNVGVFGAILLVATGVMLIAFRYDRGTDLVRAFLLGSAGVATAVAFVAVTGVGSVATGHSLMAGLPTGPITAGIALGTAAVLWVYPEWYVNDLAAVVFGAAVIPMLGLGFGPLPIVVLLVVWAGYDAYSVYVSGHMEELAAGLAELRAPIVFVVPNSLSYTMREDGLDFDDDEETADDASGDGAMDDAVADEPAEDAQVDGPVDDTDDDETADAAVAETVDDAAESDDEADEGLEPVDSGVEVRLLGLGDAIIPGMLAVSASQFLDAPAVVPALNANLPAVGAVLGGLVGMAALLYLVHRVERVHAGLPPLNAGVIGGYLVGAVLAGIPVATALGL